MFEPTATDTDLQTLRYGIINKPTWATFDPATGRLSGTPPKGSAGTYATSGVSVTDGASTASLASFTITVTAAANAAPQILGTPSGSVQVGQTYDFVPAAADADGDTLRFAIVNAPSWASFDSTTGRLTGKPQTGNEGPYADIVISVSDSKLISFLPPFTITVAAAPANKPVTPTPNSPPTISGTAPSSAVEGAAYAFQPGASDVDADPLTYSASNLPAWLAINAGTGRVSGVAPTGSAGTYSGIVVSVSDGKASVSLPAFSITVTKAAPTNAPPTITGSPATGVKAGQEYSFRPTASDADGDSLTYSIGNKPAWLNFSFTTGQLLGTPSDAQVGTYSNIRITVSDGKVSVALPAFSITVSASSSVNSPPKISGSPAVSGTEGMAYSFTPSASDPDGQALRFGIANMPAWAVFDSVTGQMSGTPAVGTAGVYSNIVISVSDGQVSATLPAFSITVVAATQPNRPPTISGAPATSVTVGQAYSFQPGASDPDGQTLAFGIANKPDWANFDMATGRLTGTPAAASVGTYSNVVISVSDGQVSASLPAFSVTVVAGVQPNRAPTISGAPATSVTVGQAYSFQPSASDPDGQTLAFGIANKPDWANFDVATGKLTGTPAAASVGTYSNVVISVSDGQVSASLPAFSVTVVAAVQPNRAPTISGAPATSVTVGQAYSFQPSASDPDGQTLAFGIANKPGWANFDVATGKLTGTPAAASVGTYSNVVISVSDGVASATLPAFSIVVKAPVIGSAELTWTAPTKNEDGTPLTNLAGYKIRYGSSYGALNQVVDVPNPGITSATIASLAAGTWYFTVASYTNTGVESAPTGAVSKTIQ